jgi:hypothetical protein
VGELAPPAVVVEVMNPACGDIMRLSVRFEGDRVAEVGLQDAGMYGFDRYRSATVEWMMGVRGGTGDRQAGGFGGGGRWADSGIEACGRAVCRCDSG